MPGRWYTKMFDVATGQTGYITTGRAPARRREPFLPPRPPHRARCGHRRATVVSRTVGVHLADEPLLDRCPPIAEVPKWLKK